VVLKRVNKYKSIEANLDVVVGVVVFTIRFVVLVTSCGSTGGSVSFGGGKLATTEELFPADEFELPDSASVSSESIA
jgi:hypothetical protein